MASSESLRRAAKPGKELHALVDCVERAWRCHLLAIAGAGAGGANEVRHSRVRTRSRTYLGTPLESLVSHR